MAEDLLKILEEGEKFAVLGADEAEIAAKIGELNRGLLEVEKGGIEGLEAVKGEKGAIEFRNIDGDLLNPSELKTILKNGDVEGYLKAVGGKDVVIDSQIKGVYEKLGENLRNVDKEAAVADNIAKDASKLNNSYPGVGSEEELQELRNADKAVDKRLSEVEKKLGGGTSYGTWIIGGAVGLGLYEVLKAHANAMSGCWKISSNPTTGEVTKCKVFPYTCDSSYTTDANDTCGGSYDKPLAPPAGNKYCSKTQTCSEFCDNAKLTNVDPAVTYKCVDASIWDASSDIAGAVGQAGNNALDIFTQLLKGKWWLWILVFFGAILLLNFLMKLF